MGNHKSPFCQVTITQNGEAIVGTVGATELQVNAPAVAAAAPPAAEAAPAAQAAAPRSRFRAWNNCVPGASTGKTPNHEGCHCDEADSSTHTSPCASEAWLQFPSLALRACVWWQAQTEQPPAALRVYPSQVSLTTARDSQSIVVQAEYANGITRDVTDKVDVEARSRRHRCPRRKSTLPKCRRRTPSLRSLLNR